MPTPTTTSPAFQSAGRIIGWLKIVVARLADPAVEVSIRRADYWLVEVKRALVMRTRHNRFQSAGRIIGWLKDKLRGSPHAPQRVSIRRADYWLVEAL